MAYLPMALIIKVFFIWYHKANRLDTNNFSTDFFELTKNLSYPPFLYPKLSLTRNKYIFKRGIDFCQEGKIIFKVYKTCT